MMRNLSIQFFYLTNAPRTVCAIDKKSSASKNKPTFLPRALFYAEQAPPDKGNSHRRFVQYKGAEKCGNCRNRVCRHRGNLCVPREEPRRKRQRKIMEHI